MVGALSEPLKSPLTLMLLSGALETTIPVKSDATVKTLVPLATGFVRVSVPSKLPSVILMLPMLPAIMLAPARKASASNTPIFPSTSVPLPPQSPSCTVIEPTLPMVPSPK
jgi:hypothetical protein